MRLKIEKGLKAALLANATITGLVSTRVYNKQAPETPVRPYILFALNAGGDEHFSSTRSADVRYLVKGVSENGTQAAQIAEAIEAALNDLEFSTDSPVNVWRCLQRGWVDYIDMVDRKPFYHSGGIYQIRATA